MQAHTLAVVIAGMSERRAVQVVFTLGYTEFMDSVVRNMNIHLQKAQAAEPGAVK